MANCSRGVSDMFGSQNQKCISGPQRNKKHDRKHRRQSHRLKDKLEQSTITVSHSFTQGHLTTTSCASWNRKIFHSQPLHFKYCQYLLNNPCISNIAIYWPKKFNNNNNNNNNNVRSDGTVIKWGSMVPSCRQIKEPGWCPVKQYTVRRGIPGILWDTRNMDFSGGPDRNIQIRNFLTPSTAICSLLFDIFLFLAILVERRNDF